MITVTICAGLALLLGSPRVTTAPGSQMATDSVAAIQAHILNLENEWAQVDVTNDRSIFDSILASELFFTDSRTGKRKSRAEFLADWGYEGVTSATNIDTVVQVFSENLAVFSGTDETKGRNRDGSEWLHQDICTDTWLRQNGVWQCIAAHCSRIK